VITYPTSGNAWHLKLRHPFVPTAQQFISSTDKQEQKRGSGLTASAPVSGVSAPTCRNGLYMARSAACECGAEEQTLKHVILQCPIHQPPYGLQGLMVLDDETIKLLLNTFPRSGGSG